MSSTSSPSCPSSPPHSPSLSPSHPAIHTTATSYRTNRYHYTLTSDTIPPPVLQVADGRNHYIRWPISSPALFVGLRRANQWTSSVSRGQLALVWEFFSLFPPLSLFPSFPLSLFPSFPLSPFPLPTLVRIFYTNTYPRQTRRSGPEEDGIFLIFSRGSVVLWVRPSTNISLPVLGTWRESNQSAS